MARSCGGGSHGGGSHGGGHHGGGSSSSSSSTRSLRYSARHRHRHSYVNRLGEHKVFYTTEPIDLNKGKRGSSTFSVFLFVLFSLIWCPVIISILFSSISFTINSCKRLQVYNEDAVVIQDDAKVLSTEEFRGLTVALRNFGDSTGIVPYVYTVNDATLDAERHRRLEENFENFAMDTYYELFSDENHFLVLYAIGTGLEADSDWEWWAIQGDNTYPLLDDDEFAKFQNTLQSNLYTMKPGSAMTAAFNESWVKSITSFKLSLLSNILTALVFSGVPASILIALFYNIKVTKQETEDEYGYYQEHGYPVQVEDLLTNCPSCGRSNNNYDETCPICGASMHK